MSKIKEIVSKVANVFMADFALAFAEGSIQRFCFYIFHQPKMPDELLEQTRNKAWKK